MFLSGEELSMTANLHSPIYHPFTTGKLQEKTSDAQHDLTFEICLAILSEYIKY